MPATGYDDAAEHIALARQWRPWWWKWVLLGLFLAAVAIGAGLAWLAT